MTINLESLIQSLEKSASDETEKKERKDEKEAFKDLKDAEKENSKEDKEDKEKDEKEDKQEKEASARGAALAEEVMQKFASQTTDKENTMNKQASEAGKAIADAILAKKASVGDVTTTNGVVGRTENKQIRDAADIVREDDKKIQATPGTDGGNGGGTVSQIFDAIVRDAQDGGVASWNQVPVKTVSQVEGNHQAGDTPELSGNGIHQEKAAAVSALVEQGFDFDDAISMVKAAAEEIEYEEEVQVKQAAIGALMDRGVDFDEALSLVKAAGAMVSMGKAVGKKGMSMGTKAAIGGAAAGAAAGGMVAAKKVNQEKKAALDSLIAEGVDYDVAAELVAAKSLELYGM